MRKGRPITGFYVESLLLIAVFIGILLALTQVFGLARNESVQAKLLTNAVTLAQEAADAFMSAAADDGEAIAAVLNENGNAHYLNPELGSQPDVQIVTANYLADMTPTPNRDYRLQVLINWQREGDMLLGSVSVVNEGMKALYTLPIAKYVGEVSP